VICRKVHWGLTEADTEAETDAEAETDIDTDTDIEADANTEKPLYCIKITTLRGCVFL